MAIYCGVDFHSRQVVAWCDTSDGEIRITELDHSDLQKAPEFYASLPGQVIIGLEASGYSQWFEDLLFELKREVRIGNAAEIRKRARSRQENDRPDAETILDLLLKDEFPQIYRPDPETRAITAETPASPPPGPTADQGDQSPPCHRHRRRLVHQVETDDRRWAKEAQGAPPESGPSAATR